MKKKKRIALLIAAAMVCTMIPATVFAAGSTDGDKTVPGWVDENGGHPKSVDETFDFVEGNIAYSYVDGGVEVSPWQWSWEHHDCNQGHVGTVFAGSEYSNRGELAIPASITHDKKEYRVLGIGTSAFYQVSNTTVVLPEGLEYLDDSAFQATKVTKIHIPSTVKRLGDSSLRADFTEITFAENSRLEEIGNMAFRGFDGTSLVLPAGVRRIGGRVFEACANLESITIPAGAEFTAMPIFGATYQQWSYKGDVVFAEGSKYRYIDGVLCDDDTAIEIREEQENIVIPEGIKYINEGFRIYDTTPYTSIIQSITLPDSLERIGKDAFLDCKALKEIVIPENVTEIGESAFGRCTSLEKAEIKGNVTELNGTFMGCSSLSEVIIPDTVTVIGDRTFSNCSKLTDFDFSNITSIGKEAFENCQSLQEVSFNKGITEIPEMAFAGCISLKKISLPEGITTIGDYAFDLTVENEEGDLANENPQLEIINVPSTVISLGDSFIGGVQLDGKTALVMQGITPPSCVQTSFSGQNADVLNIIVPAGSQAAYAANEQFAPFVTEEDGTVKEHIGMGIELDEEGKWCPGDTFQVKLMIPNGAEANVTATEGAEVGELDENTGIVPVTLNGNGEVTVTAEIVMEGISILSRSAALTAAHSWGEPEWNWTEEGCTAVFTCRNDATHTESVEAEVTTEVRKAPTCTEAGEQADTASVTFNGKTYTSEKTVELEALGHRAEKTEALEATCTEDGHIEYWYCEQCGKYFSDEALTEEIAEEETVLPALGHQAVKVESKAPTATEAGNIEYWYCEQCGKYISDEALTREIAKEDTVLKATGEKEEPDTQEPATDDENTEIVGPATGDAALPMFGALAALSGAALLLLRRKK